MSVSAGNQLAAIVDGLEEVAVVVADAAGTVTTWNAGARRLTGLDAGVTVGRDVRRLLADTVEGDVPGRLTLEGAERDGRVEDGAWLRHTDGTRRRARVTIAHLRTESGEPAGFSVVGRGVELAQAHQQLEHLGLAVASIRDYAIFLLDAEGRVATWNTGAREIKGYRDDEIIGEHFSRFYTEEDLARGHPDHELEIVTREGRYEEEGWRVRKDGTRFWANVVITALRDDAGALLGFAKVTRDLTGRRVEADELRAHAAGLADANRELEQLRLAVGAIGDYGIFLLDADGRVRTWNRGARRLKGYEADDIIGEHFSRFYTEEDLARDYPAHELAVARREGHFEDEGWRVRKDGSRFWANVVITALSDESGEVTGFVKVTRDLTARRRVEEDLRTRAMVLAEANRDLERLRLAVTTIRDYAIFLLEPDGRIATWNEGARRIKGYEAEEIIGQHFSRFYTEEDLATDFPARELETAARVGRFEDEGWRLRKDGTRFWANVVITAARRDDGELIGFSKVTRDLSDRRAAEEELRRTAAELREANREIGSLRLAVASISDYAIFLLDPDGHVATWNEGARRLKGYEPSEIIGEHFSRFYTEEHLAADFPSHELEIAARAGRFEDEGWRVRKDGTRFWANVVITAVRDESDTLVGYAKVTRDLTQRRRAEDALRATAEELERTNAELERFAGAAAHDLVQPLHTIVGLADVIRARSGDDLDARTLEALGHIRTAGLRLADRVDALLRYARSTREELAVQAVSVAEILDHVEATLHGSIEGRGAVIEREDVLGTVRADPALLEVVLQNLLENALKFSESAPRIRVGSVLEGTRRRLTVSDNGIGIGVHDRDRIFQLFSRAGPESAYAGAGMGLALSRQVVERHGGEIGVEPNRDDGSTFWFTLPTTDRLAAP